MRPSTPAARSALPAAEIAARLRLSATRLARRLRQESGAGLSPSQLSALAVVDNHGPVTLGALAEHERVAPPTITKVVSKLECDGLVIRTPDPSDRRVCRVEVSAAGADLLQEIRRRKTAWLTARITELDPESQRRLAEALDVLDDLISGTGPST
ncbi:MAG TPA: MarR family transcriptional regulator [Acidimicrobiia bacterium]|nr:MarR family transcriptional regulator [Acidimicrobiia bacterium]